MATVRESNVTRALRRWGPYRPAENRHARKWFADAGYRDVKLTHTAITDGYPTWHFDVDGREVRVRCQPGKSPLNVLRRELKRQASTD